MIASQTEKKQITIRPKNPLPPPQTRAHTCYVKSQPSPFLLSNVASPQVDMNPSLSHRSFFPADLADVPNPVNLASAQVQMCGRESAHVASSVLIHVDLPQSLVAATNLCCISQVDIHIKTSFSAEATKAPKCGQSLAVQKEARNARSAQPRHSQYSKAVPPSQHPQHTKISPHLLQRLTVVPACDNDARSASPDPSHYKKPAPLSSHCKHANFNQPSQQNPQAVPTRGDVRFATHSLPQQVPSNALTIAQGNSKKRHLGLSAPHFPAANRGYQAEKGANEQAGTQHWQHIKAPQPKPEGGMAPYVKPAASLRTDAAAQMQSDNTCESFENDDWHEAEECFSDCSTDQDDEMPANQAGSCGSHSVDRVSRKTKQNRMAKLRKKRNKSKYKLQHPQLSA